MTCFSWLAAFGLRHSPRAISPVGEAQLAAAVQPHAHCTHARIFRDRNSCIGAYDVLHVMSPRLGAKCREGRAMVSRLAKLAVRVFSESWWMSV